MTTFIYTSHDGQVTTIEAALGESVMRAATTNGVPGVVGECGGVLSCATCHVFVDPEVVDVLPPVTDREDEMLEGTAVDREPTSRLSCQLQASDQLETLRVTTPEYQE
ncbi:2Fe-2S iron-sulfur cluster-binding protein [Pseudonocardia sp. CA-107938]|uniref:2Fe-2S iron-sulfur cluster-binding protein n=1 Tax=Pseudonocardia sp. CA-107938 TaxID=3240021 RepID=UPI003D8BEE0B